MLKILNRLAWLVSLVFGFVVTMFIGIGNNDLYRGSGFDSDYFFLWLLSTIFFGILAKQFFLSKRFIARHLNLEKQKPIELEESEQKENSQLSVSDSSQPAEEKELIPEERAAKLVAWPTGAGESLESEFVSEPKEKKEVGDQNAFQSSNRQFSSRLFQFNFIKRFFQKHALAKVGGILLFLGVLFLLQLVYTAIGPIGKLMIGFAVGFTVFSAGMILEKRGYKSEARVMFGAAILINYLVILAGRYLIGEGLFVKQTILNESITFFLLIVNTVFATTVAMAYGSRNLFFFSFVVAYFNPFLIGGRMALTTYTFLAYGLIISLAAVILSHYYKKRSDGYSYNLLQIAFWGGNFLALFAPCHSLLHWVLKLASLVLISLLVLYLVYARKEKKLLGIYFAAVYLFFIFFIANGRLSLGSAFSGVSIAIINLLFITISLAGGLILYLFTFSQIVFYSLLAPLLITPLLFFANIYCFGDIAYIIIAMMILYLMMFLALIKRISQQLIYVLFGALGVFIFLISVYWGNILHYQLDVISISHSSLLTQTYGIIISAFIFLLFAYYLSRRKGLEYLYSVATIFTITMFVPVMAREGDLKTVSIVSMVLFLAANIILPFVNKKLVVGDIKNSIFGLVAGAVFVVGEVFWFWFGDVNQSKITLGMLFLFLAILYFILSYLMYLKISSISAVKSRLTNQLQLAGNELADKNKRNYDSVYALLGVSISLFSLAVAYVFSRHSEIISSIWLFEAVLMFYFYRRRRDIKFYAAGLILMTVSLMKMVNLIPLVGTGEYVFLIPLAIMLFFIIFSLWIFDFEKTNRRRFYEIEHITGIILITVMVAKITPNHNYGWLVLVFSLLGLLLSLAYFWLYSAYIKNAFLFCLFFLLVYQIVSLSEFFNILERVGLNQLKLLQPLATAVFIVLILAFNKLPLLTGRKGNSDKKFNLQLNIVSAFYLFIVTTQYVYYLLLENEFLITIYWGILALIFLSYGIQKDYLKLRTLGLYIIVLTVGKILVYDIWSGLEGAILRVVALMVVGGVMIIVSVLYSKKYDNDLKGELAVSNLWKQ